MGGIDYSQFFPPRPAFTEKDVPSLQGRVFVVTGGNAGVGFELAKMLHALGGTAYIACRSAPEDLTHELDEIKTTPVIHAGGQLHTLPLDLADLSSVAACARLFLSRESRLDVLFNNAGIAAVPPGANTLTAQGIEAVMGTNCVGHYLLTKLLLPVLISTARLPSSPPASVRIVFVTSGVLDLKAPEGGVTLAELEPGMASPVAQHNYASSKAGSWFLAAEFDRQLRDRYGIVCVAPSPGTLKTKAWAKAPWTVRLMMWPFMQPPRMGAYTELWAGLSPEVRVEDGGRYAVPFGRWHSGPREDILRSLKRREEGGTGVSGKFFEWCGVQTRGFEESG